MKVSVCITLFNEEESVTELLNTLLNQTKKPSEIVIVDGGSTDKTVQIIRHFQKKDKSIKLLVQKCTRAEGRNLSVDMAKNDIIAMTDGECKPERNWIKLITDPFKEKEVDIVAGFYSMMAENPMQEAMSVFLGVLPEEFSTRFLPSTRSIAFRKRVWSDLGGFPEDLKDTAEDTVFNYKAVDAGKNFARIKKARVEWKMPESLKEFSVKIKNYAKGDVETGVFFHKSKGITSHNVKAIFIIARYLLAIILTIMVFFKLISPLLLAFLGFVYLFWSFSKVFNKTKDFKVAVWGIVIQVTSDLSVIRGFVEGLVVRV